MSIRVRLVSPLPSNWLLCIAPVWNRRCALDDSHGGCWTNLALAGINANIPGAQRRAPAPELKQKQAQYKDHRNAVVAAYETGEYRYQQIENTLVTTL